MEVRKNVALAKYTTFHIGGKAKYFFAAKNKEEIIRAVKWAKEKKLPFFILGGGSNILVADRGFNGLVIKIENRKLKIVNYEVNAGAGESLGQLVSVSVKYSLSGLEWASGIPGTVGGAIRGNVGAFGGSMDDIVEEAEVLDANGMKFITYNSKECGFDYRNSIFKKNKNLIIISATLKLKKGEKEKIKEKIKEYLNYRKEHHPVEPSAGSVFKNFQFSIDDFQLLSKKFPEFAQFKERGNVPAAFLISQCGLKGKKIGGAVIFRKQPNFILNFNNARAKDVKDLIKLIKNKVKNKFGIVLEEEIELF